jgi:hypothetical protein
VGLNATYYIISKMIATGKPANPMEIFDTKIWQYYCGGCFSALIYLKPNNLEIRREGNRFFLENLGSYSDNDIGKIASSKKIPLKIRSSIDEYFENEKNDQEN